MSDETKMQAMGDGVYAWMAEHPISVHDAIEDGVRKAVEAACDAHIGKTIVDAISATVADELEAARAPGPDVARLVASAKDAISLLVDLSEEGVTLSRSQKIRIEEFGVEIARAAQSGRPAGVKVPTLELWVDGHWFRLQPEGIRPQGREAGQAHG